MTSPQIGRIVTMRAKPGMADRLIDAMTAVADAMRDVPGCVLYTAGRDGSDQNTVRVMEIWADQESSDTALATTPTGDVTVADVLDMLTERPEVVAFTPVGGTGVDRP